ncbi:MAG TPA: CBS domain-containing protein, partial [Cellvibrionaceae bacterium]
MPSADDLADSLQFLQQCPPFDQLDEPVLLQLCQQLMIHYQPQQKGAAISTAEHLTIIRTGAVELRNRQGGLVDRLHEGDVFGLSSALDQNTQGLTAHTLEDCLLYRLPKEAFERLMRNHQKLAAFFRQLADRRQSMSALEPTSSHPLLQKIEHWMSQQLVTATPEQSVQEGAQLMSAARVSSLLIARDGELLGIVTDRDLRSRVLAEGLGGDTPLARIMSAEPASTHPAATLMDAQWLMSEKQLHHLPVLARGHLVGMLTITDLMRAQEDSPLFFVQRLSREDSLEGLERQMAGCRDWLDRLRQQDSALPLL